jgi:hypothetical protein
MYNDGLERIKYKKDSTFTKFTIKLNNFDSIYLWLNDELGFC